LGEKRGTEAVADRGETKHVHVDKWKGKAQGAKQKMKLRGKSQSRKNLLQKITGSQLGGIRKRLKGGGCQGH